MHDGVIGKIFGTRLGLGFLNMNGDSETLSKHQLYINELQQIEKDIRAISHELKNELLSSKKDFIKIIESLIEEQKATSDINYKIIFDNNIYWDKIDDIVKINFYRIIQEALQNIKKHANATHVKILLNLESDILNLSVIDNGMGFDSENISKGIGIKNMRSRAQKLKGSLSINSKFNKGTEITISIPVKN